METVSQNRRRKNSSFIVDIVDKYVRITVESEELMNKPLLESDFIYNVARTICTGRLVGTQQQAWPKLYVR